MQEIIRLLTEDKTVWENSEKYSKNAKWYKENFKEIQKIHGGKVVVVLGEKIEFSSEDVREVRQIIRSFDSNTLSQLYIRYVPKENEAFSWL